MGWQFQKYYKNRTKIYSDLIEFCVYCKNQISFLNNDKQNLISSFLSKRESLISETLYGKNQRNLNEEENGEIIQFINNIGKFDVEGELQNIEYYSSLFMLKKEKCQKEESTIGVMCLKLGWLLGLLLCIVLY